MWKFVNSTSSKQYCEENCPTGYYKKNVSDDRTCVTACFDAGITDDTQNYYEFDGLDKVCYQDCPDGYYGDPSTGSCVSLCPANAGSNHGYFVLGEICSQYCDGSTYAYHPTRECLTECPTGFYMNTYTVGADSHNICEDVCSVTMDGDKVLGRNYT